MKNRILLLQPTVGPWDQMRSKPAAPLALLHAASLAVQEFEVEIFDRRLHEEDWQNKLKARIGDDLLLVGVTGFTGPMLDSSLQMVKLVRAFDPAIPVVWGGIHASLMPQESAKSPDADFVIQGEGERPLLELARALRDGTSTHTIPGVWTQDSDGNVVGQMQKDWADLSEMPTPPWHLVNIADYLPQYKGRKSFFFQSSRGCPLACTYCYNVTFNARRWRKLSPEKTVEQITYLVKNHGVEDIYFVDDMFFTDIRRARAIAEGLRPLNITWQVQGVDILGLKRMTDEDYDLILASGCNRLTVGIESGSPRVREYVKKDGTVEDVLEVTARLRKWPITLFYSFMCGIPTETYEEVRMTVDLIFKLMASNPNVRVSPLYNFSPYPGTELFDIAVKNGLEVPQTLEGWSKFSHDQTNLFPERRAFYESLYFTSLFIDHKAAEYGVPMWVRLATDLYRPIARYRTRNFFFKGMVEREAMNFALTFWRAGQAMRTKRPLTA